MTTPSQIALHTSYLLAGMAKIRRFQDLRTWQTARVLMNTVYDLTEECKDYQFRNQIRDAAVSIMSNTAEGFDSLTKRQFIRYLGIAKASAGEVKSHLYVALDRGYVSQPRFQGAYDLASQVSKQLWKLIIYLRKDLKTR